MSWRLYVDIGNGAVKYGARQDGEWVSLDYVDHMLGRDMPDGLLEAADAAGLAASTPEHIVEAFEEYLAQDDLDLQRCSGIGVASTCDGAEALIKLLARLAPCPLKRVGRELKPGLKTEYRKPSEIGADRWANVVAATKLHGAPVVVIDAGTALTSEVVNGDGVFLGGSIGLGILPLSMGVAFVSERLADASLKTLREDPPPVGRSTTEAIHMGLVLQLAAAADRFAQVGLEAVGDAPVVLTGGNGDLCLQFMRSPVRYEPLLTLEGIRLMDHYE
jgi:pantothenate kinase type III